MMPSLNFKPRFADQVGDGLINSPLDILKLILYSS